MANCSKCKYLKFDSRIGESECGRDSNRMLSNDHPCIMFEEKTKNLKKK